MKLSPKTLAILSNFAITNNSLLFLEGKTQRTKSLSSSSFIEVEIEENIPKEFGIYDLKKFHQTLSAFDNPEIDFEGDKLIIKEGNKSVSYITVDKKVIKYPKDSLKNAGIEFHTEIELNNSDMETIIKHNSILGTKNMVFSSDGENLKIILNDIDNVSADIFEYEIGECSEAFEHVLETDVIKMLPLDYKVSIGETAVKFSSEDSVKIDYWFPIRES